MPDNAPSESTRDQALAYLAGEMDATTRASFERQVDNDAELAALVEEERALNRHLRHFKSLEVDASSLAFALEKTRNRISAAPAKAGRLLRFGFASGVAAALVLGAFVVFSNPAKQDSDPAPIANKTDPTPETNIPDSYTFADVQTLDLGLEGKVDEKPSREATLEAVQSLVEDVDSKKLEAVLSGDIENIRVLQRRSDLWKAVAEGFDPTSEEALQAAFEKLSQIRKAYADAARKRGKKDGGHRNGKAGSKKREHYKKGEHSPLVGRVLRKLHDVEPKNHRKWIDALRKRVEKTGDKQVVALRKKLREAYASNDLNTRLAPYLVGQYRAAIKSRARYGKRSERPSPIHKVEVEEAIRIVNEHVALAFLAGTRSGASRGIAKEYPEARERMIKIQRRMNAGALRDYQELHDLSENMDEAKVLQLMKEKHLIAKLGNLRGTLYREIFREHILFSVSEGREGQNMLDLKTLRSEVKERKKAEKEHDARGDRRPGGPKNRGEKRPDRKREGDRRGRNRGNDRRQDGPDRGPDGPERGPRD